MSEVTYLELTGTISDKLSQITRARTQLMHAYFANDYPKEIFKDLDDLFGRKICSIEYEFDSEYDDEGGTYEYVSTILVGIKAEESDEVSTVDIEHILDEVYEENGKGIHIHGKGYLEEEYELREYIVDDILTGAFDIHDVYRFIGNVIKRPEGM